MITNFSKTMYKKIFITGGHGKTPNGYDSGAVALDGTKERTLIVEIGKFLIELFEHQPINRLTHYGITEELTVVDKANKINTYCNKNNLTFRNSLLIDLHVDWRGAGAGIGYYHYPNSPKSISFGASVVDSMREKGDRRLRFVKPSTASRFNGLWIIDETEPLAVLIEMGSLERNGEIDNTIEYLSTKKGQKETALGITNGVHEFAGWGQVQIPDGFLDGKKVDLEEIDNYSETYKDIEEVNNGLLGAISLLKKIQQNQSKNAKEERGEN